jgi:hypothetical protein
MAKRESMISELKRSNDLTEWCRGEDLNLHGVSPTST